MQRVTVASGKKSESGKKSDGTSWTQDYQEAYLHEEGKRFPTSCRIVLYDGARPFSEGDKQTDQRLKIDQYGKLRVESDLVLSDAPPAKA